MDCVADEGHILVMAISEHVENAGVHSGDATMVQPPQDLNQQTLHNVEAIARSIAGALAVSGIPCTPASSIPNVCTSSS